MSLLLSLSLSHFSSLSLSFSLAYSSSLSLSPLQIKCILISLNERLTLIEKRLGIFRGSSNDDADGRVDVVGEDENSMNRLSNNGDNLESEDITPSRGTITSNSSSQVQTDSVELHGNLSSSEGDTSGSFFEMSNR